MDNLIFIPMVFLGTFTLQVCFAFYKTVALQSKLVGRECFHVAAFTVIGLIIWLLGHPYLQTPETFHTFTAACFLGLWFVAIAAAIMRTFAGGDQLRGTPAFEPYAVALIQTSFLPFIGMWVWRLNV